eukprot:SAG11_NODE_29731_length_307_cov_20.000000_1_plen_23_part_01
MQRSTRWQVIDDEVAGSVRRGAS